jgi:hypothetical protein
MYNFKRLVAKYSKKPVYKQVKTDGYFDYANGGEWVEGALTEVELVGAIVPLTGKDLIYEENGTYSQDDRKLYCYELLETGTTIKHNNKIYTVSKQRDYADFDENLRIYILIRRAT